MKNFRSTTTSVSVGLVLLAAASAVSAAPPGTVSTAQFPRRLIGSDTLNKVMDDLFVNLGLKASASAPSDDPSFNPDGYNTYYGIGSTGGELQLEGSPAGTEPTCLPADSNGAPDTNPGCEEISPMSRPMDSSICEDEESAGKAEGLAIAKDGLVLVTNNAVHQRFSTGACPSPASQPTPNDPVAPSVEPVFTDLSTGRLRNSGALPSGYVVGGGTLGAGNQWRDVVRVIYTGCLNDQGDCTLAGSSPAVPTDRLTRCSAASNPVRQEILSNWGNVIQGTDCASGTCANGVRQLYRRDDASGTTQVFAQLIGVRFNTAARTAMIRTVPPAILPVSATHTFCDGGQFESFWPQADGSVGGDPITRACAAEDDLCSRTGSVGVVRPIRTPLEGAAGQFNFPPIQCTRGRFARVPFLNTGLAVCPDGTVPSAGQCLLPYFLDTTTGARDFNCLNDPQSRPSSVPSNTDGRAYNWVVRDSAGAVQFAANLFPQVAQWRQNMAGMDVALPVPGGPFPGGSICQQSDATRLIGCLVANTTCTLGFAGREAAYANSETYDNAQEPLWMQGSGGFVAPSDAAILSQEYPFWRDLFISAIGGFENITTDCVDRITPGASTKRCADQVSIASAFYNMAPGDAVSNIIRNAGFIPFAEAQCVGTQGSAGCGAPTVQAKSACQPL